METISVLHITDLHFGSNYTNEGMSDKKETGLNICNHVGKSTWQRVFIDSVRNWASSNGKIDCVVCTGDLIENGGISEEDRGTRLNECVSFLLNICHAIGLTSDNLLIAPGNHDLNRSDPEKPFADLEKICKDNCISKCATDQITNICVKDELNIFAINSCMGATEKVEELQLDYYENILNDFEKSSSVDTFEKLDKYIYQKDLDIPAIGDEQTSVLIQKISSLYDFDSIVLLMHHNPIPLSNIEIRPYANVIDGGRLISDLLNTGKNTYILHGHTHMEHKLSSFIPSSEQDNFISFLGGAQLHGGNNSKAFIVKYYSSNKRVIKTNVYEIKRQGSSFPSSYQFSIDDYKSKIDISIQWHKLSRGKTYTFDEIKAILEFPDKDEELIKNILLLGHKHFKFKKTHNDSFLKWEYIYI